MLYTFTLHVPEIIYDIENKTFLTGRSLYSESDPSTAANLQVNGDMENINEITRAIISALAHLRIAISDYLPYDTSITDNRLIDLTDQPSITLILSLDDAINSSIIPSISPLLHDFIVAFSIARWFRLTNKQDYTLYVALYQQILEQLNTSLSIRKTSTAHTPIRRPLSPF